MDRQQDEAQAIQAWLQDHAIPIQHLEAGHGFADLQPLKPILQDARVVGLGEATHGTREFFQLKHRLLEFFVTELQFTAFALEASYAACQPINDYIQHASASMAEVVSGQGYVAWDTEEFSAMVDWLRNYNQDVPDDKKVTFHGVDVTNNALGRQAVMDYLYKLAPDATSATAELFQVLAEEEAKWPRRIDDASKARLREVHPSLLGLMTYLTDHKDCLVSKSSAAEFERIFRFVHIMQQWLLFVVGDGNRSCYMAENLTYILEQVRPGAKCVVWAHNSHISVSSVRDVRPNMGSSLRETYGDRYFAVGLEFNQGTYQARTMHTDTITGDLKEIVLPPAPAGSLPWHVSQAGLGNVFINCRQTPKDTVVEQWLRTPQRLHLAPWIYTETTQLYIDLSLEKHYDGSIVIGQTTRTQPTANASTTAARREGF